MIWFASFHVFPLAPLWIMSHILSGAAPHE
jgi:hypothetical protein